MMNAQQIDTLLSQEELQKVIKAEDFYFQKGRDAVQSWQKLAVSEEIKEELFALAKDYHPFVEATKLKPEISEIRSLLLEIIAYCDNRARYKSDNNRYKDDRVLADASVRMGDWMEGLLKFKFKHEELTGQSIINALNYLLNPRENCTVLSEGHREMLSTNLLKQAYDPNTFIDNLKAHFKPFQLKATNPDNLTYLYSAICYAFKNEWIDEVIGLMASDGTGWQEEALKLEAPYEQQIIWNSKKPSGWSKTQSFLKNKVKAGELFPLFYSSGGQVTYRANIIDFATNQKELDSKNWKPSIIKAFHTNFEDYHDDNKKARIIFLVDSMEKIAPLPNDSFAFYGGYSKPTQDNLSPVKEIPSESNSIKPITKDTAENMITPLNQIFYGPPGTGKTYHTVNEALAVMGVNISGLSRQEIKSLFDAKVAEGQVVFTTFHQSMTYEDFIEGIKPDLEREGEEDNEEGSPQLDYVIKPGIFKKIAEKARKDIAPKESFDSLWQNYITQLFEQEEVAFNSITSELKLEKEFSKEDSLALRFKKSYDPSAPEGKKVFRATKKMIRSLFNAHIDGSEDNSNGWQEVKEVLGGGRATVAYAVYKSFFQYTSSQGKFESNSRRNYVLIIDEINRGNVSQIFGELITLLEEDKRIGRNEALEITLPYSKKPFGVPDNLYLIGTMNTADRSVEALDTALRRRFSFTEMPPQYDLGNLNYRYANSSGGEILKKINQRIEKLLDKDHLIGHSYFLKEMDQNPETKLLDSFYRSIIPLLQEYFYGDYDKIGAVLGVGFIYQVDQEEVEFAAGYEDGDFLESDIYRIVDYRTGLNVKEDMSFEKAIKLLMNKPVNY